MKMATVEEAQRLDNLRKGREAGFHELRYAAMRVLEFRDSMPFEAGVAVDALDAALYKANHGMERPASI
jgi:hypothetical protein